MLRIDHLLDRRVGGLSGGDRQRVALGRAIVRRPKAFLMDEPLGALDSEFRRLMCSELRELHDRIDATTVYITHDQLEAMAMADRIAIMNQGRVEQIGTPQEIYDRPASMFVADFIGAPPMSFLTVQASPRRGDRTIKVDGVPDRDAASCSKIVPRALSSLGVRPENVSFADAAGLRGEVIGAEYLGTTQIVTVTTSQRPDQGPAAVRQYGPRRRKGGACVAVGQAIAVRCRQWPGTALGALCGRPPWLRSRCSMSARAMARSRRSIAFRSPIAHGEFVVLLGPTGAGKTTTLRLIAGLERPDRGSVVIQGRVVTREVPAERDVAFVFQQYSLYPHLSVYDNLAFPLRSPARRVDEKTIRRRIQQIAELLHIEHKLNNRATALSGGEMQRVAIGRALVREPAVYLMDEPLSSLDAKLRAELRLELKRIQREMGTTILYVTHDQIEAMTMADRIGVMNEGALIQLGTPREIYERPNTAYVAGRLGTPVINLIPAELLGADTVPPQARTIGLRTEHIRISAGGRSGTTRAGTPGGASRRSEPRSPQARDPFAGDACGSRSSRSRRAIRSRSNSSPRSISIRPATASVPMNCGGHA